MVANNDKSADNRKPSFGVCVLAGLGAGVLSSLHSESLVPGPVANPATPDLLLANRLGFIYSIVVGLWLAWFRRAWPRAAIEVADGSVGGLTYMWLCASRNFLAIIVG